MKGGEKFRVASETVTVTGLVWDTVTEAKRGRIMAELGFAPQSGNL